MALNRKFLQDVEELIDIAHKASSEDAKKNLNRQTNTEAGGAHHNKETISPTSTKAAKPKSRLTKIQKAFILAEILPRKY